MAMRLETQKPPTTGRYHSRANSRPYVRGYLTVPHSVWGDAGTYSPPKGQAGAGAVYPPEATVTASDATNAAKLGPLGYVAQPTTAWTGTQKITVGTWDFFWDGGAWRPGNASRNTAAPATVYPADPEITASDSTNAAKLAGEGFKAAPQTNWTTGQKITIGTYDFNWTGAAWAAGTHA